MTKKRFTLTNPKNSFQEMKCGINDGGNTLTFNEVVALLNNLSDENEWLKKALFFFLDIAISESSTDYQNDLNKCCNRLFNCNYEEAKRKYGNFKYNERWESE